jgi:hypothetical protein
MELDRMASAFSGTRRVHLVVVLVVKRAFLSTRHFSTKRNIRPKPSERNGVDRKKSKSEG